MPVETEHPFSEKYWYDRVSLWTFAGDCGKLAEIISMKIWTGGITPSNEQKREIEETSTTIITALRLAFPPNRCRHQDLILTFERIISEPACSNLLSVLGDVFNLPLLKIRDDIVQHPSFRSDYLGKERLFLLTVLALAKELVKPTLELNSNELKLLPNIVVPVPDTTIQFDGVLVPPDVTDKNVLQYITEEEHEWHIVDVKNRMASRSTSGKPELKNKKPLKDHVNEFKTQFGRFLIWCCSDLKTTPLPKFVHLVYLNGVFGSKIHSLQIDPPFLENWQKEIEAAIVKAEAEKSEQDEEEPLQMKLFDDRKLTFDEKTYLNGVLLGIIDDLKDKQSRSSLLDCVSVEGCARKSTKNFSNH